MAEPFQTLAEVAERYRFTERWLRDFIRSHGIPVFTPVLIPTEVARDSGMISPAIPI